MWFSYIYIYIINFNWTRKYCSTSIYILNQQQKRGTYMHESHVEPVTRVSPELLAGRLDALRGLRQKMN